MSLTIICRSKDYRGGCNAIAAFVPGERTLIGNRDKWESIEMKDAESVVRFHALVYVAPFDDFCRTKMSLRTRFKGIVTVHEERKARLLESVNSCELLIGVVAEPKLTDRHEAAAFALADQMDGLVFDGHGIFDVEGDLVLDLDGGVEY